MASITLKHIRKVYPGDVVAVQDFCLEIEDREFVILVGPSGCGKSTTLRMIAGLEEISDGELYIGDRLVNDVAPKDRDIAMVFQNYALYPHMTVYKNMAFGLELRKTPKPEIEEKVKKAAEMLDIAPLLNRKPKALSGGQRQRVALGRALVRDPAVFLLDEPLSNLDAKLRTAMRAEIIQLHNKLGTTFVYVTHDQTEAMTMGDRIVVMNDGWIQQVDTPQMLYDHPCNKFVAAFIGAPQMNFFNATLQKTAEGYSLDYAGAQLHIPHDKEGQERLAPYVGKVVCAGLRPENIHIEDAFLKMPQCAAVEAEVELSEAMGAETYIYLLRGEDKIIAKVPNIVTPERQSTLRLAYDCRKLHLFDPETEEAIFD